MAGACSIYRDVDKFIQNLVENLGEWTILDALEKLVKSMKHLHK
jgi:hypothetical protein